MEQLDDLCEVRAALEVRGLRVIEARLPSDPVIVFEDLLGVAELFFQHNSSGVVFLEQVGTAPPPMLSEDVAEHAALLEEFRDRWEDETIEVHVAAAVDGVLVAAQFVSTAWVAFTEAVSDLGDRSLAVSDELFGEWVTLCAADDEFRRGGSNRRAGRARDLMGPRGNWEMARLVEAEAMQELAESLGPQARQMHSEGMSKEAIRVRLGVTGPMVSDWLA